MESSRRRRGVWIAALVITVSGCGAAGSGAGPTVEPDTEETGQSAAWERGAEPWRGLLTTAGQPEIGAVTFDGLPPLPATAPAYRMVAPTKDDLQALAETYAGGPVQEGIMPGGSPDLISFDAGDGWFHLGGGFDGVSATWSWVDRLEREHPSGMSYDELQTCPPGMPVPAVAADFLGALGYEVAPNGRLECMDPGVRVWLQVHLGGLPVAGLSATAVVVDGRVVDATAPFLLTEPLGEVELAPAGEVARRLAYGPGVVPEDPACDDGPCQFGTADAELALAPLSTGGIGNHDHTVGGAVPGRVEVIMLPALRATTTTSTAPNAGIAHRGAVAVSSALLVDDPADAEVARRADEVAAAAGLGPQPTNGCAGTGQQLAVCSSAFEFTAGEPVVITVSGEVNEPVGAADCSPILTLDLGDGVIRTAPPPLSGTLLTARMVHVFAEPGEYTVTAHRASQCDRPAGPGGTEPEYDEEQHVTVTVIGEAPSPLPALQHQAFAGTLADQTVGMEHEAGVRKRLERREPVGGYGRMRPCRSHAIHGP